jgi:hypothetical protein
MKNYKKYIYIKYNVCTRQFCGTNEKKPVKMKQ